MISDHLSAFCKKYLINVLDSEKRCTVKREQFFIDAKNKDEVREIRSESEQKITLTIPISRLETLASIENVFYNNTDDHSRRNTYVRWMSQQKMEKFLRDKYPAVQDAYEKYSMMLHLVSEKDNQ